MYFNLFNCPLNKSAVSLSIDGPQLLWPLSLSCRLFVYQSQISWQFMLFDGCGREQQLRREFSDLRSRVNLLRIFAFRVSCSGGCVADIALRNENWKIVNWTYLHIATVHQHHRIPALFINWLPCELDIIAVCDLQFQSYHCLRRQFNLHKFMVAKHRLGWSLIIAFLRIGSLREMINLEHES